MNDKVNKRMSKWIDPTSKDKGKMEPIYQGTALKVISVCI